uniref:Uncharacterized protein n=1 Tax=Megaselia scalaris TaxID=36166 RepID=T1H167_MEGSC
MRFCIVVIYGEEMIEEIQAQETEEVHQSSDDHQVYNVSWPSDESAEINDVGLEDEDVKPDEDDFGTFQDFTEYDDLELF